MYFSSRAKFVVLLMDFDCPIEKDLSVVSTIQKLMSHPKFWNSIFKSRGKCEEIVFGSPVYIKVKNSLEELPSLLQNGDYDCDFIQYLSKCTENEMNIEILRRGSCENNIYSLIMTAKYRMTEIVNKMDVFIFKLKDLNQDMPNYMDEVGSQYLEVFIKQCEENFEYPNGQRLNLHELLDLPVWDIVKNE